MTIVKAFYDTFKRSASVILCRQCQKDDEEDDNVTNLLEGFLQSNLVLSQPANNDKSWQTCGI